MIDREAIREASLNGMNAEIRGLLLSDNTRDILLYVIKQREVTASKVAERFNISIQHASGSLAKMYKQGYLRRLEQPQNSGGYEWRYFR